MVFQCNPKTMKLLFHHIFRLQVGVEVIPDDK
jgi:hypothetical protein